MVVSQQDEFDGCETHTNYPREPIFGYPGGIFIPFYPPEYSVFGILLLLL